MNDDTISRQAAIRTLEALANQSLWYVMEEERHAFCKGLLAAQKRLSLLPSTQPKKGKWIFVNKFQGQHKCSVCGVVAAQVRNGFHLESSPIDNTGEHAIVIDHYKEQLSDYCPNCGHPMEVEE